MVINIAAIVIAIVLVIELYLSAAGNQHLKKKLHKGWNRTRGVIRSIEKKYDTFSKKNVTEVTIEAENGACVYAKEGYFCIYEEGEEVELEEKDGYQRLLGNDRVHKQGVREVLLGTIPMVIIIIAAGILTYVAHLG